MHPPMLTESWVSFDLSNCVCVCVCVCAKVPAALHHILHAFLQPFRFASARPRIPRAGVVESAHHERQLAQ